MLMLFIIIHLWAVLACVSAARFGVIIVVNFLNVSSLFSLFFHFMIVIS